MGAFTGQPGRCRNDYRTFAIIFRVNAAAGRSAVVRGYQLLNTRRGRPRDLSGLMYQWRILSMTGQTPADGGAPLTLLDEPSINENGAVAFLGELSGGGEGVIAVSPTLSQTVVSFADPVSNRTFGPYVQINDASQVLAADDTSGMYYGRLWLANKPGTSQTLLKGGSGQAYLSVLGNGSVNKSGAAVVPAINNQGGTVLVSIQGGAPVGTLLLPASSFAFPQIADNGSILVVYGPENSTTVSPIEVWNQTFGDLALIADGPTSAPSGTNPESAPTATWWRSTEYRTRAGPR